MIGSGNINVKVLRRETTFEPIKFYLSKSSNSTSWNCAGWVGMHIKLLRPRGNYIDQYGEDWRLNLCVLPIQCVNISDRFLVTSNTVSLHNISEMGPASLSSGQSFWLLIRRSRVGFPVLRWGFFLEGEDSHGDHDLGSLVELRFKAPPITSYSYITIHLIGTT
jgi:hypothetical protein